MKSFTKRGWKHYFIHDNGGRAFVVFLFSPYPKKGERGEKRGEKKRVNVYARDEKLYHYDVNLLVCPELYTRQILDIEVEEVFIGRSPKNKMTEYSGGYGPDFDGNSILLHVKDLEYIYIGSIIYSFTTRSHVTKYVSPVGNSDVSYPYVYDEDGNCYLMLEDVMMTDFKLEKG